MVSHNTIIHRVIMTQNLYIMVSHNTIIHRVIMTQDIFNEKYVLCLIGNIYPVFSLPPALTGPFL